MAYNREEANDIGRIIIEKSRPANQVWIVPSQIPHCWYIVYDNNDPWEWHKEYLGMIETEQVAREIPKAGNVCSSQLEKRSSCSTWTRRVK